MTRPYRKLTPLEKTEASDLYRAGATLGELAARYGCSSETVRAAILALGVPMRTGGIRRRMLAT